MDAFRNAASWYYGDDAAPDQAFSILATSATAVTVTGLAGSDFGGAGVTGQSSSIQGMQSVEFAGTTYALSILAGTGTATVGTAAAPTLLAEEAGSGQTVTFQNNGGLDYWHLRGSGNTATLSSGQVEIYMPGALAAYTASYATATGTYTLVDGGSGGGTGTTTLHLAGGTGEIVFTDGNAISLGDLGDATELGGTTALTNTFTLDGGTQTLNGEGANAVAKITEGDQIPDDSWDIYQDTSGRVVMDGTDAGYDGVATMNNIAATVMGRQIWRDRPAANDNRNRYKRSCMR